MDVPLIAWILTITTVVGLLLFDFFAHVRKAHEPTLREAAGWSGVYVGLGLLFGLLMLVMAGPDPALEYYAGYLTEKALSVDNLFVFLIIISSFGMPRRYQQKVLLFGIVLALISRTGFILLGAGLIEMFSGVFYIFGAVLLVYGGEPAARGAVRRCPPGAWGGRHGAAAAPLAAHLRAVRRRPAHHPDAAGDARDRRDGHLVRPGLDPGDLRAHPGAVHRVRRHRVLPDGAAAAVLPHRRAGAPARVPVLWADGHPRVHRGEAGAPRAPREPAAVHQRRAAGACPGGEHDDVAARHPGCAGGDRGGVSAGHSASCRVRR